MYQAGQLECVGHLPSAPFGTDIFKGDVLVLAYRDSPAEKYRFVTAVSAMGSFPVTSLPLLFDIVS
jgi:hypothetical protein